jgi:hypothetical protein
LASLEDGLKEDQLLDTYEKALKAKIAEEEKTRR